jgi:hypothetical protein
MKKDGASEPAIRVIDDDRHGDDVVRLGGPTRLAAPPPSRLEFVQGPAHGVAHEARSQEPGIEEILDVADHVEPAEGPMERGWGGEGKRWLIVPWGWFVVIAGLCLGLAAWSLHHLARHRGAIGEAAARVEQIEATELRQTAQAEQLYQRLEARVTAYLAADSVDQLLPHVRQPERVAALMRDWHAREPVRPARFDSFHTFQPVTLERRPFWIARVETSAGQRTLLLEQTEGDDGLVDWETDVCYQPLPWNQFVGERPAGSFNFRVNAVADNYYTHEFADEGRYRSFRLTARDSAEHLFGYVRRGSRQEQQMLAAMGQSTRPVAMVLEIGFVPDSAAQRAVMIFEVVSPRWCLVNPPAK